MAIKLTIKQEGSFYYITAVKALKTGELPGKYIRGYPSVRLNVDKTIFIIKEALRDAKFIYLDYPKALSKLELEGIIETCRQAGQRLHEINKTKTFTITI